MKNLKFILLILFASILFFSFCSCGARKKTESNLTETSKQENDIKKKVENDIKAEESIKTETNIKASDTETGTTTETNTTKYNTVFDKDGKPHAMPVESTTTTTTNYNNTSDKNTKSKKDKTSKLTDKSKADSTDKTDFKNNKDSNLETEEPKPPNNGMLNKLTSAIVLVLSGIIAGIFIWLYLSRK